MSGFFRRLRDNYRLLTQLRERSAQYAAAKSPRTAGTWSPVDSPVNEIIGASSANVRARVRQLVRDMPFFARAVNIMTEYTVGEGIGFQSRVKGADGKLDIRNCTAIEDAFKWWSDEADFSGRLHFNEIIELDKRQDCECGEFLMIQRQSADPARYLPFALQLIEADWLDSMGARPFLASSTIDQGIEYNPVTGQTIGFHFADPDSWGKSSRVRADQVIHGFQTLRPGQLRGISPFAPGVMLANDLAAMMDATVDATKLAAKWLALVETPDPAGRQVGVGFKTDSTTGNRIEELENAIIDYLRPGEKVTLSTNPNPGQTFVPFVKLVLCMFSVTTGAPYELISGNYEGLNYTVSRTVRNDFAHTLRPICARHIRHACMPPFKIVMDQAVLRGKLALPGYWTNPRRFWVSEWQPPGMEPIDPLKESKAAADDLANLLRSPQEIVKRRGRDLEDVYNEIAAAKKMADDLEITPVEVSTALAGNPAAVEDQKALSVQLIELVDKLEMLNL